MEEQINEQTFIQTQPVATDDSNLGDKNLEVSLGKFKDVNALLNAYNSLQSEFTKRCQKIKELESALSSVDKITPTESKGNIEGTNQMEDTTLKSEEDVLKEYLQGVLTKKPKAIVMDGLGAGVKAPINKPKTIEQAGKVTIEMLAN